MTGPSLTKQQRANKTIHNNKTTSFLKTNCVHFQVPKNSGSETPNKIPPPYPTAVGPRRIEPIDSTQPSLISGLPPKEGEAKTSGLSTEQQAILLQLLLVVVEQRARKLSPPRPLPPKRNLSRRLRPGPSVARWDATPRTRRRRAAGKCPRQRTPGKPSPSRSCC